MQRHLAIALVFATCFLAAPAASTEPDKPQWSDATPPARFQRVGLVPVVFVHPGDIAAACTPATGKPPAGLVVVACTRAIKVQGQPITVVIMPDPCAFASIDEYAQVQCHENAHYLAGWQHETE